MRITLTLLAMLPIAASAADGPADAGGESLESSGPQDIVVTATRDRRSAFSTPASITRIDDETLVAAGAKHQADVLNRVAGVYVQRGSGAPPIQRTTSTSAAQAPSRTATCTACCHSGKRSTRRRKYSAA